MSKFPTLEEIERLLKSEFIRERKQGIQKAAELLANGLHRKAMRDRLAEIARNDLITGVGELAQAALDEDDQRHAVQPPRYQSDARHMFGAECPKGHVHYYDKRLYCPKQGNITRRTVFRDGVEQDEILVKCTTCGVEFVADVACEGYK